MVVNVIKAAGCMIVCLSSLALASSVPVPESDQQVSDFSLAGYGDGGRKTWDLAGKSADMSGDMVKLQDIAGTMYREQDQINVTADKGNFDRKEGSVHLEDNVVVSSSAGATLTTDSLDWDRKNNTVSTPDQVNIERENMMARAIGALGDTALKQVTLQKDVQVDITPVEKDRPRGDINRTKVTITCDGPMEIDYDKSIAIFQNNVKVDRQDMQVYSDRLEVYFLNKEAQGKQGKDSQVLSSDIEKIVSKGNVKIVRGENVSYSEEAVYNTSDRKITLLGQPRIVIYSTEGKGAPFGN